MRPLLRLLDDSLIDRIIDEARTLLERLGLEIHNPEATRLLAGHGARVDPDSRRVHLPPGLIDRALATVPRGFRLHDALGNPAVDLSGDQVNFTPGSSAINILDADTGRARRPTTADYVRYVRLASRMEHVDSQSTAMIPSDVPERISDSYRLYLSLRHGEKPVVTGAFTIEAFGIMRDLLVAVRGTAEALAEKPLALFSCCPTSPLKWGEVTAQNLLDCARHAIPVEYVSMPLSGFMAPVTLTGTLVQHTAETLGGVVISQLARPGTPALYGGSPAFFDVRYETTPMGSIATMMIDCGASQIGHRLGLPTQAYIALSDAKQLDAQAGLESGMGAVLAALAGIDQISGPGMLDFESCFSLEKLVVDNEICGMVRRLARGIEPKEDFPSLPRFEELLRDRHLLISPHTRRYLKEEDYRPGPVISRANRMRWEEEGATTLPDRARQEVERLVASAAPSRLSPEVRRELERLMAAEARRHGLDRLPEAA